MGSSCGILTNVLFPKKTIPKPVITQPLSLITAFSVSSQNLIKAQQKAVCMCAYVSK